MIWNKKFLTMKRQAAYNFGIAPTRAKEDDMICILLGCSVPVVLRPVISGGGRAYELIGDAYIHYIMDGEELRDYSTAAHEELIQISTEFRLV